MGIKVIILYFVVLILLFLKLITPSYNSPIGIELWLSSYKDFDEKEIDTKTVQIGNLVKLLDIEFDEEVEYTIVGSTEVNLAENKVSNVSPIGKALLGRKKGETVDVEAPAGTIQYKILAIKK